MLPELAVPILNAMRRLHRGKKFDMTPLDEPITISADPVNLSELMSILLDNAGKWAERQVQLSVIQGSDGAVTIRIADDGPGMTTDQIARACEVGTRFDPSKPGSGLGLAMARDMCADLGAELELRSDIAGLSAVIRFPA